MTSSVKRKFDRSRESSYSSPSTRSAASSRRASRRLWKDSHATGSHWGSRGRWDAIHTSAPMDEDGRLANWSSTATANSDETGPRSRQKMHWFRSRLSPEGEIEDLLQRQRDQRLLTRSTRTWTSPGRSPEKLRFDDHPWTSFYVDQTLVRGECSVGCFVYIVFLLSARH